MTKRNMRKLLILLMLFAIMLCFVGCRSTTANKTVTTEIEMNNVEAFGDGWTHDQISDIIYLCGEPFSLPCTVEELEARGFSNSESIGLGVSFYEQIGKSTDLFSSDSEMYSIKLEYLNSAETFSGWYCINENGERVVWRIDVEPSTSNNEPILLFNGVSLNDGFLAVKKALGDSCYEIEGSGTYVYDIKSDLYQDERLYIMSLYADSIFWVSYSLY